MDEAGEHEPRSLSIQHRSPLGTLLCPSYWNDDRLRWRSPLAVARGSFASGTPQGRRRRVDRGLARPWRAFLLLRTAGPCGTIREPGSTHHRIASTQERRTRPDETHGGGVPPPAFRGQGGRNRVSKDRNNPEHPTVSFGCHSSVSLFGRVGGRTRPNRPASPAA